MDVSDLRHWPLSAFKMANLWEASPGLAWPPWTAINRRWLAMLLSHSAPHSVTPAVIYVSLKFRPSPECGAWHLLRDFGVFWSIASINQLTHTFSSKFCFYSLLLKEMQEVYDLLLSWWLFPGVPCSSVAIMMWWFFIFCMLSLSFLLPLQRKIIGLLVMSDMTSTISRRVFFWWGVGRKTKVLGRRKKSLAKGVSTPVEYLP